MRVKCGCTNELSGVGTQEGLLQKVHRGRGAAVYQGQGRRVPPALQPRSRRLEITPDSLRVTRVLPPQ